MNPEIKSRWVADLHSGLYEQTYSILRSIDDDGWCCLGVLCDIYSRETENEWTKHSNGTMTIHGEGSLLPKEVAVWAGLESTDPIIKTSDLVCTSLSILNDTGKYNFDAIADIIDTHL